MTPDQLVAWAEDWAQRCLEHALIVRDARDTHAIFKAAILASMVKVLEVAKGICPGCDYTAEQCVTACAGRSVACCPDCKHISIDAIRKGIEGEK